MPIAVCGTVIGAAVFAAAACRDGRCKPMIAEQSVGAASGARSLHRAFDGRRAISESLLFSRAA